MSPNDPVDTEPEVGVHAEDTGASASALEQTRHLFTVPRRAFAQVIVLGTLQAGGLVAFALLAMRVVDSITPGEVGAAATRAFHRAIVDTLTMGAIAVGMGVARTSEFAIAERAGYEVARRLRMEMYAHLQRMLPAQLRHRARGGLLLRLTGDLSMLRMWLSRGLMEGTSAIILLIVGLATLLILNVDVGLAAIACLSLGAVVSVAQGRAMREATRTMRRRRSLLIGNIDEQINALAVVQMSGRAAGEYARLSRQNDSLNRALCRVADLRGRLRGLATLSTMVTTSVVLLVGIVEAQLGRLSLGSVVACLLIARLLSRPVRTLGLAHDYWHRGLVSRQKVAEFLTSSARPADDDRLEPLRVRRGLIEFDGVCVPGQLDAMTVTAPPGRIIALTGEAGAGQTVVLDVLARLVEPSSGTVRIDGQDVAATAPQSMGRQIGYVSPDLPLLRGSVRRNLTYAAAAADPAEIQRVALALGLDERLREHDLPGVNAWLVEGGRNLPLGDRQLIAIARAMIGNPPILLLDDPFAGLDRRSRAGAQEAILRHHGTVLIASQDERDLALADEVWFFEDRRLCDVVRAEELRDRSWLAQQRKATQWRQRR